MWRSDFALSDDVLAVDVEVVDVMAAVTEAVRVISLAPVFAEKHE